jgi:hypothetical protein
VRAEDKRIGIDKDEAETEQRRRQDRAHDEEKHLEQFDDRGTLDDKTESAKADHCSAMMRVMDAIFRKTQRPLDGLTGFSFEEEEALKFLEAAVKGRDAKLTHIVYAEDREDMLEQALAVLYPTLSHGMEHTAPALREEHDALVEKVTTLRKEIANKEDAQEDPIELRQRLVEEEAAADESDDEDDDGDAEGGDGGAPGQGSTLTGDPDDPDSPPDDDTRDRESSL